MPSITAEEAPRLTPFVRLAEQLGSFAGQLTESGDQGDRDRVRGRGRGDEHARADRGGARRLAAAAARTTVNMVSAPVIAKERGIMSEVTRDQQGAFESYIRLTVDDRAAGRGRSPAPFLRRQAAHHPDQGHQHGGRARAAHALRHQRDKPGFIGRLGTLLGDARRQHRHLPPRPRRPGGDAIALLDIDAPFPEDVLAQVRAHKSIDSAKPLHFDVEVV